MVVHACATTNAGCNFFALPSVICCVMQVGQLQGLARHPVVPLLNDIALNRQGQNTVASDAGIQKLACVHLCPPNLHNVGAFQKLLDHLGGAEHFVLEHGTCPPFSLQNHAYQLSNYAVLWLHGCTSPRLQFPSPSPLQSSACTQVFWQTRVSLTVHLPGSKLS
jgi:hypothetical protein